jgi:hypothetical protein
LKGYCHANPIPPKRHSKLRQELAESERQLTLAEEQLAGIDQDPLDVVIAWLRRNEPETIALERGTTSMKAQPSPAVSLVPASHARQVQPRIGEALERLAARIAGAKKRLDPA